MSVVRMRERECVLERVRIIEGFFKENICEFSSGHWKLSEIERCPYRKVRL